LHALDDIVARIQEQNNTAHETRSKSLTDLASDVKASYKGVESQFSDAISRSTQAQIDVDGTTNKLLNSLAKETFEQPIVNEVATLRERMEASQLDDYVPTGQTPRSKEYSYRRAIPRTDDRPILIQRMNQGSTDTILELEDEDLLTPLESIRSPSKGLVFADFPLSSLNNSRPDSSLASKNGPLSELDLNSFNNSTTFLMPPSKVDILAKSTSSLHDVPPLKRLHTTGNTERKAALKKRGVRSTVAGKDGYGERENVTLPNLSASVGTGSAHPLGRRLRSGRDRS
jgi:hypothetical protein